MGVDNITQRAVPSNWKKEKSKKKRSVSWEGDHRDSEKQPGGREGLKGGFHGSVRDGGGKNVFGVISL